MLLSRLQEVVSLGDAYQEQFRSTIERPGSGGRVRVIQCDESAALAPLAMFGKRCAKLKQLFSTLEQFSVMEQQRHMDGIQPLVDTFKRVATDIRVWVAASW